MLELIIKRTHMDMVNGTAGTLAIKGQFPFCVTLEKPWLNNQQDISCIPAGRYRVTVTHSAHFGRPLPLVAVGNSRAGIRIHPANLQRELLGCIAVGESFDLINGRPGVSNSRGAFDELMAVVNGAIMQGHEIWLTIENHF